MSLSLLDKHMQARLRSGATISCVSQCVQELVENSIDAGANCIIVHIDMRRFRIKVLDNGSGITYDDLKLIGERYFTSKCHSLSDLENLKFCGFRGEALASIITSAGTVDITSRHKLSSETYTKVFRNSKSLDVIPGYQSRPTTGTTVTVHDFFYNLPVRRLGTVEVLEMDKLQKLMECIALINPSCSFFINNDVTGECVFKAQKTGSVLSSFSQLFGSDKAVSMRQVSCSHACYYVHGYISSDGYHNKSLQFLYVNGRVVKKTSLHSCVNNMLVKFFKQGQVIHQNVTEVFRHTPEKHGMYILLVECPRMEYDVCFEPTKTLIEFKNWDKLLAAVEQLVESFAKKYILDSSSSDEREGTCSTIEFDDKAIPYCTDLQFQSALCSEIIQRKVKRAPISYLPPGKLITSEESSQVSKSPPCVSVKYRETNKFTVDLHGISRVETCKPASHELRDCKSCSFIVRQVNSHTNIHDSLQDCKKSTELYRTTSSVQSQSSVLCSSLHSIMSNQTPAPFSNEEVSDSYVQVHTTSQPACIKHVMSSYSTNKSSGVSIICNAVSSSSSIPVNSLCLLPITSMFGLKAVVRSPLQSAVTSAGFIQLSSLGCDQTLSPKHALREAVTPLTSIAKITAPPLVCSADTVCKSSASVYYPPCSSNIEVQYPLKLTKTSTDLMSATVSQPFYLDQAVYSIPGDSEYAVTNVMQTGSVLLTSTLSGILVTACSVNQASNKNTTVIHKFKESSLWKQPHDYTPNCSIYVHSGQCLTTEAHPVTSARNPAVDVINRISNNDSTVVAEISSSFLSSMSYDFDFTKQQTYSHESLDRSSKYRTSLELRGQNQCFSETSLTQFLHIWENPIFNSGDGEMLNVGFYGNRNKTHIQLQNVVNKHKLSRCMFQNVKVIGQVDCKFIACLLDSKQAGYHDLLVMVDQHAAHERVRLETLSADMYDCACKESCQTGACCTSKIRSSVVQPPILVNLKPADMKLAQMFRKQLEKIGISVVFEGNELLITSIPSLLMEREVSERKRGRPAIATNVIQELIVKHLELLCTTSGSFHTQPPIISKVLCSQACHGAIKFGDQLSLEECQSLIQQLSRCKLPFQCAHGRPSVIPLVDMNLLDKGHPTEERFPTWKC